jgi:hypothetical protein
MAHRFIELRFTDLAALHQQVLTVEVALHVDVHACQECLSVCCFAKLQGLLPKDDRQCSIQAWALGILTSLQETRWLIYEQESTGLSMPMLVILISWLTTLFISFGLFAPTNRPVVSTLLVSGMAVSGAILLILELYSPFEGVIRISSAPLRAALTQWGN